MAKTRRTWVYRMAPLSYVEKDALTQLLNNSMRYIDSPIAAAVYGDILKKLENASADEILERVNRELGPLEKRVQKMVTSSSPIAGIQLASGEIGTGHDADIAAAEAPASPEYAASSATAIAAIEALYALAKARFGRDIEGASCPCSLMEEQDYADEEIAADKAISAAEVALCDAHVLIGRVK